MKRSIALALLTMGSISAYAAPTTYVFDIVTSVSMDRLRPEVRGTEKDTGNPLQISFQETTVVDRCVPLFLTTLEKPGKYFLYLTVDPAEPFFGVLSCRLEVRT